MLKVHDPSPDLRDRCLGNNERVAVPAVESNSEVSCQFEVLALIISDRNTIGVVKKNVGGHESRIGKETSRDELGIVAFVLELSHAP